MIDHKNEQPEDFKNVEFLPFLLRCLRNWFVFLISLGVAGALSWYYLSQQSPLYLTTSKVIIQDEEKSDFSRNLVMAERSALLRNDFTLTNEIQILASNRLLQRVVSELGLHVKYYKEAMFSERELYRQIPIEVSFEGQHEQLYDYLFHLSGINGNGFQLEIFKRNSETGEFNSLEKRAASFGEYIKHGSASFAFLKTSDIDVDYYAFVSRPEDAAYEYADRLEIEAIDFSNVLLMSIRNYNPEVSSRFLKKLIDVYNDEVLKNKNVSTNNTLKFIDERLSFITTELFDIETELQNFKQSNEVPLEVSKTASQYLEKAGNDEARLQALKLQAQLYEVLKKELEEKNSDKNAYLINVNIDGEVPQAVLDHNRLIEERGRLLSATPDNPLLKQIEERIDQSRSSLMSWLKFKESEVKQSIDFLNQQLEPINAIINQIPVYEREMLQIMRQQVIKESLFTFLLQRREETALLLSAEVSNARIINDPKLNSKVSPNIKRTYALSLFLGLLLPASFVFLREYFDRDIRTQEDISKITSIPFLGMIPASDKNAIDAVRNTKSIHSEMFRMVLTNINYLNSGKKQQVFLVTSSISGEGKTYVSINLASIMAGTNKKVVLVGMDLRKPRLSQYITGSLVHKGVSNYLVDDTIGLKDIVHKAPDGKGMYFIGSGSIPPNPNELLKTERTNHLIDELKQEFDYVIIDSPPVGLVADSFGLANLIDTTLLIVKYEYSKQDHVQLIESIYKDNKLPNPAIILNGVKKRLGQKYNYGYGYGYYAEKKPSMLKRFLNLFSKN